MTIPPPTIFSSGVEGDSSYGVGVQGNSSGFVGVGAYGRIGVYAHSNINGYEAYLCDDAYAGYFRGPFYASILSHNSGGFLIDHPVHPAQKCLSHAFVESSDMKNIYDGTVMLDTNGEGKVELPDWVEALNTDFRYQLTCIGAYAPVFIARKIHNHCFTIAGGKAGMEISWQVTGIRKDAWANANRIQVETEKPVEEQGYYFAPELYGEPAEKSIQWLRHPKEERPKPSQM